MTAPLTPERLAEVRARNDRLLPNVDLQCPVEVADEDGHLHPCGKVTTTWRWYDGDDHEPMLMACCYGHETNGAEELATVLADDVPDLLAAVDAATERAEKAEAALERVEALSWSLSPAEGPRVREELEGKP